jgi:hypothetical protein
MSVSDEYHDTLRPYPRLTAEQKARMPHMAKASFTRVGNSADSPEPPLRPLPVTGHATEILDV